MKQAIQNILLRVIMCKCFVQRISLEGLEEILKS